MKHIATIAPLLLILLIFSLHAQAPLSVLYGSGSYLDNGQSRIDLLTPSDRNEELITWDGSALEYQPMQDWILPTWKTATTTPTAYPFIGFKSEGDARRINPIFWNGTGDPPAAIYSQLATDPAGDHLFTNPALDLLELSVSFTDTQLYFSIRNSSGTYPTSSGVMTYYSYMALIIDPDADPDSDPIVWSLMHTVNVSGIIGPGLYKITGTGTSDQTLIGNITQSIVDGALVMSCNLSDLINDPDFSAWFDPQYPRLSCGSMTSRITLTSGVQEADSCPGAEVLLMARPIPSQNASEPYLSAARVDTGVVSEVHYAQGYINYFDADTNFPRSATFTLDDSEAQPLYILPGQTPAFDQTVGFYSAMLPFDGDWSVARFRFAHGDGYVESVVLNGVPNSDEHIPGSALRLNLYPNPVSELLKVSVNGSERHQLSLYNLKGQRLMTKTSMNREDSFDVSSLPAGIYLVKVTSPHAQISRRVVKLDR